MARIVVTSDLHLGITTEQELRALAEQIAAEQPELTVLAGDIGEGLANIRACLRLFEQLPGQVAVLMGNHDLWMHGNDSQALWEELLPGAVRDAGMIWLDDAIWRGDGIAVVGSMAWYDYSAVDPTIPPQTTEWYAANKGQYDPDAIYINWKWSDLEMAQMLGDALVKRMESLEDDPTVQAVMVVTHVPLYRVQMFYKPGNVRWGTGNAYFGNMTLGQRLLTMRKLRRVISGHTHIGREGSVDRPDLPPLPVSVLASDYHRPIYLAVDSSDLLTN
ncbi:MAG TPA: metallophosphoesterase [Ktedonobacterales bacterium]|nr:metallophosphoesterase [Ktedonobacterales bacterium]